MRLVHTLCYSMITVISLFGVTLWSVAFSSAIQDAGAELPIGDGTAGEGESSIEMWQLMYDTAIKPEKSASEQIQKELGVAYDQAGDQRATYYIQQLINRFLAIAWLVALIVLVYGFFKMFFAKDNEEAFQEALKIVKGAVMALLIIWVSWFIVSAIFDLFFTAKEDIK